MRFCKHCESILAKQTTPTGIITFQCRCQYAEEGRPEDTLMSVEFYGTEQGSLKHDVLIENAPFDLAGNIVMKDCIQCNLNYMTMIRIGEKEETMYTCSCGYRATHAEYMNQINKKV